MRSETTYLFLIFCFCMSLIGMLLSYIMQERTLFFISLFVLSLSACAMLAISYVSY